MPSHKKAEAAADGLRRYRLTVRARFALTYCLLLTGAGAVMLGLVYVFMRFVPTYDFMLTDSTPAGLTDTIPAPAQTTPAVPPGTEQSSAATTMPASDLLISSPDQLFNLLLIVSIVVLVILALVGIGVGWAAAGRMLRPLQHINDAVSQATKGDLSHRIALVGPRDEISELASNFDGMLEQLQDSMAASKRFAANSSHELRTPLATTRALIDLAMVQTENPEELAVFDRLRQTNERSIQTVEALLGLAQIEAQTGDLKPVSLDETVREAVDLCAVEAPESGVEITVDLKGAMILGEPILVRQLCLNLVQNAIRHNLAADGTITIRTRTTESSRTREGRKVVQLVVENTGEVLEDEWVASLTEPFIRSGGRTATKTRGHGLGLSIVAAIVRRVDGDLALAARPGGGLRVVVEFAAA